MDRIPEAIRESIEVKEKILDDSAFIETIRKVADEMVAAYGRGNKVLFCGNGGSAADAQHLAAELSGRFYFDRDPLNSEALHVNTSYVTAVANDYSFDEVFARQVRGRGRKGDVLFGISTSGNSPNVVRAIDAAREKGMLTVGLTGQNGGKMKGMCTYMLCVPSSDTPRIQEAHILVGHLICELVESSIFGRK